MVEVGDDSLVIAVRNSLGINLLLALSSFLDTALVSYGNYSF